MCCARSGLGGGQQTKKAQTVTRTPNCAGVSAPVLGVGAPGFLGHALCPCLFLCAAAACGAFWLRRYGLHHHRDGGRLSPLPHDRSRRSDLYAEPPARCRQEHGGLACRFGRPRQRWSAFSWVALLLGPMDVGLHRVGRELRQTSIPAQRPALSRLGPRWGFSLLRRSGKARRQRRPGESSDQPGRQIVREAWRGQ